MCRSRNAQSILFMTSGKLRFLKIDDVMIFEPSVGNDSNRPFRKKSFVCSCSLLHLSSMSLNDSFVIVGIAFCFAILLHATRVVLCAL